VGWKNEKQIEELLVATPDLLGEDLLIIDRERQFRSVGDLVALDRRGRVVVIEIKDERVTDHQAAGQVIAYWAMTCQDGEAKIRRRAGRYLAQVAGDDVTLEAAFEAHFGVPFPGDLGPDGPRPRAILVCEECKYISRRVFDAVTEAVGDSFDARIAWVRRWRSGRTKLVQVIAPALADRTPEELIRVGDVVESMNPGGGRYLVLDAKDPDEFLVQRLQKKEKRDAPKPPDTKPRLDHHRVVEEPEVSWGDHGEFGMGATLERTGKPERDLTFVGAYEPPGFFLRLESKDGETELKWKPLSELGSKYRLKGGDPA